ncbi:MBL fold metallo-hydrolase [Anderseniella sp. Alg231-50]|uniref:MBL fold metallo-hydrolase n=1 Tax=Anderseniella sp. Alg231-50 TaxID=1922226 RepID=UPI000D5620E7
MSVTVTFAGSGDAFGSGGRLNTCIVVDAPEMRFAVDFGASSLVALNRLGIDHNTIEAIVVTHLHGDHAGGIPFMLLDAMLGARRQSALTIIGPPGIERWVEQATAALFPGSHMMKPRFALEFVELSNTSTHHHDQLAIEVMPAIHTPETLPTSVRLGIGGKIISYTGDGEWNPHMPALAQGADLLIMECYAFGKPVKYHLNYPDIAANREALNAKRIVLTHMGPDMLAAARDIPEATAFDGMVITL